MSPGSGVLERHRRACAELSARVEAVAADQWDQATPCPGWNVAQLVEHVTGNHERVLVAVGGSAPAVPGADRAGRWMAVRDALFTALEQEGALDIEIDGPMGRMAVGRGLGVVTTDTLVHTWDLSRAIGADEALPADLVAGAHQAALPFDEVLRVPGMFEAKVDVADDADEQTRMLAFFGRRA